MHHSSVTDVATNRQTDPKIVAANNRGKYICSSRHCSTELCRKELFYAATALLAWKMEPKFSCKMLYLPTKLYDVTLTVCNKLKFRIKSKILSLCARRERDVFHSIEWWRNLLLLYFTTNIYYSACRRKSERKSYRRLINYSGFAEGMRSDQRDACS
jgi:hypothetical protein